MTAAEVKDALRRRHPAVDPPMLGEWTCIEEFHNIDLLAISAWHSRHHRRVGYEVKVSRGDYRRELLNPSKRAGAVAWCHEFYFAVPHGLLTPYEISFVEPELTRADYERDNCPERCRRPRRHENSHGFKGTGRYLQTGCDVKHRYATYGWVECETCGGQGYLAQSRVERELPQLWVPKDVGLIEVRDGTGRIARKPPRSSSYKRDDTERRADALLAEIVRHTSARPDPRHAALRGDVYADRPTL